MHAAHAKHWLTVASAGAWQITSHFFFNSSSFFLLGRERWASKNTNLYASTFNRKRPNYHQLPLHVRCNQYPHPHGDITLPRDMAVSGFSIKSLFLILTFYWSPPSFFSSTRCVSHRSLLLLAMLPPSDCDHANTYRMDQDHLDQSYHQSRKAKSNRSFVSHRDSPQWLACVW